MLIPSIRWHCHPIFCIPTSALFWQSYQLAACTYLVNLNSILMSIFSEALRTWWNRGVYRITSHFQSLGLDDESLRKTTLAPRCPSCPHSSYGCYLHIVPRQQARPICPLSLVLALALSYVVAGVADLPINTETLSSMTKHIRILLANTHTHTHFTYANSCVCWPGQALWPSETAAQPTTSINLVDGLPRRLPFLAHKPCVCVFLCVCVWVCVCMQHWMIIMCACPPQLKVRMRVSHSHSLSLSHPKSEALSSPIHRLSAWCAQSERAGVRSSSWANKQSMFIIYLRLFTFAFYVFLFTLLRTAICLRANEISATDWLPLRIVASFCFSIIPLSLPLFLTSSRLPPCVCVCARASELSLKLIRTTNPID